MFGQSQPPRMPEGNLIESGLSYLRNIWYNIRLTRHLMLDGRVKLLPKIIPPFVLLYGISPIDLSTILGAFFPVALIPGIAAIDDIFIIKAGLEYFVDVQCPPEVVDEYKQRLEKTKDGDS